MSILWLNRVARMELLVNACQLYSKAVASEIIVKRCGYRGMGPAYRASIFVRVDGADINRKVTSVARNIVLQNFVKTLSEAVRRRWSIFGYSA